MSVSSPLSFHGYLGKYCKFNAHDEAMLSQPITGEQAEIKAVKWANAYLGKNITVVTTKDFITAIIKSGFDKYSKEDLSNWIYLVIHDSFFYESILDGLKSLRKPVDPTSVRIEYSLDHRTTLLIHLYWQSLCMQDLDKLNNVCARRAVFEFLTYAKGAYPDKSKSEMNFALLRKTSKKFKQEFAATMRCSNNNSIEVFKDIHPINLSEKKHKSIKTTTTAPSSVVDRLSKVQEKLMNHPFFQLKYLGSREVIGINDFLINERFVKEIVKVIGNLIIEHQLALFKELDVHTFTAKFALADCSKAAKGIKRIQVIQYFDRIAILCKLLILKKGHSSDHRIALEYFTFKLTKFFLKKLDFQSFQAAASVIDNAPVRRLFKISSHEQNFHAAFGAIKESNYCLYRNALDQLHYNLDRPFIPPMTFYLSDISMIKGMSEVTGPTNQILLGNFLKIQGIIERILNPIKNYELNPESLETTKFQKNFNKTVGTQENIGSFVEIFFEIPVPISEEESLEFSNFEWNISESIVPSTFK